MSSRVLSTQTAKDAINQVKTIIDSGLQGEIAKLEAQAQKLSDANNWDGPLAERFRNDTWPTTKKARDNAKTALDTLHQQLNQISANIFSAGGA